MWRLCLLRPLPLQLLRLLQLLLVAGKVCNIKQTLARDTRTAAAAEHLDDVDVDAFNGSLNF